MSKTLNVILLTILFSVYICNAQTEFPPITDEMIKQCEQSNSCNDIPGYPRELIAKVLEEAEDVIKSQLFKDEEIKTSRRENENVKLNFCSAMEELISPLMAQNEQGIWVYIVNPGGEQTFRIESCISPGESCSKVLIPIEGYTSKCQQNYIYREALSIQNNKPKLDKIRLKSCCNCVVSNTA